MHITHVNLQVCLVRNALTTNRAEKVTIVVVEAVEEAKGWVTFVALKVRFLVTSTMEHEILAGVEDQRAFLADVSFDSIDKWLNLNDRGRGFWWSFELFWRWLSTEQVVDVDFDTAKTGSATFVGNFWRCLILWHYDLAGLRDFDNFHWFCLIDDFLW